MAPPDICRFRFPPHPASPPKRGERESRTKVLEWTWQYIARAVLKRLHRVDNGRNMVSNRVYSSYLDHPHSQGAPALWQPRILLRRRGRLNFEF